ncbi:unnamed protein product [Ilex paraguariensis]|uniref:CASP-like protein n=1 Tax=Ilex paraguariensis TaxID=185542 RepID=A0ABC8QSH7_9AQUA
MKNLFGCPWTMSGLVLRIGQCIFAAASIGVMATASGFSTTSAFCYLIASMGLQILWSFGLAYVEIHALRLKSDLTDHAFLSLFILVGDWVTATLSFAAVCSSAGVVILFMRDTNICRIETRLSCYMFLISIALAFGAWLLLAISSHVMFWFCCRYLND